MLPTPHSINLENKMEEKKSNSYQPKKIKIPLKPHQSNNVDRMIALENSHYRMTSRMDFGILGDKVGAGKSLSILALIAAKPICTPKTSDVLKHYYPFIKQTIYKPVRYIKSNLIIVPHNIINQWKMYINTQTDLKCYSIERRKDIRVDISFYDGYDIILCKSTMWRYLYDHFRPMVKNTTHSAEPNSVQKLYGKHQIVQKIKKFRDGMNYIYKNMRHTSVNLNRIQQFYDEIKSFSTNFNMEDFKRDAETIQLECKGKHFTSQAHTFTGYLWNRVIIDEADSIQMPRAPRGIYEPVDNIIPYGCFNWFISSSKNTLIHSPRYIRTHSISSLFFVNMNQTQHNFNRQDVQRFANQICIYNSDEQIQQSFQLPPPIYNYIPCYTPLNVRVLQGVVNGSILECLAADNISQAIKNMGCNVSNQKSVIKVACIDIKKNISKNENEIKEIDSTILTLERKYFDEKDNKEQQRLRTIISNRKKRRVHCKKKIERLSSQIITIEKRIKEYKNESCPICLDDIKNPTHVVCCKQILCFKCITMCISRNGKCPLCRSLLNRTKIVVIDDKASSPSKTKTLPTKMEKLCSLIKEKKDGKFLVFSSHDASFFNIMNELNENGIVYRRLQGHVSTIDRTIKEFKEGKIRVLMLNSKSYASGMNLEMTTDIIIYHRMSYDMEQQVIGRGQRLGRTKPLNIHYLCHKNELPQSS